MGTIVPPVLRGFRASFNFICALVLVFFLFRNQTSERGSVDHPIKTVYRKSFAEIPTTNSSGAVLEDLAEECMGFSKHIGFDNECEFLKSHSHCLSDGLFDYLSFFYCTCGQFRILGYIVLGLWLVGLFYMLGNTAADFFCCSLEKLSSLLKLPPTVAGVTLLPLGNGAPDVFASIAAFMSNGNGNVGLNSVLGGAVFITCIVVGTVSFCVSDKMIQIDRRCFFRDIGFFLLTLVFLSSILIFGKVNVWGALFFVFIYVLYAFTVAANELLRKHARRLKLYTMTPLLPVRGSIFSQESEEDESIYSHLLDSMDIDSEVPQLHALPQWMWATNVAIYSNQPISDDGSDEELDGFLPFTCSKICSWMELPLILPRRLTIPIIEDGRWSKFYAVSSAFLAPILLAFLWNQGSNISTIVVSYIMGILFGVLLAVLAYLYTIPSRPPQRFLFPWVFGGFFMSIVWFYIIANELVSLLVSLGAIFGINPSILGLTVLAWGNSMGDLMSNVALAANRGKDGLQIAMSGCYAGPMFNTLAGLGVSMLLSAMKVSPQMYILPSDTSLVYTMAFLMFGLLYSLVVLPRNDMRPNKLLGTGLIIIYAVFLIVRISIALLD
ncbi:Cation/calcium exchanger 4 [Zostera marina]|uniref:Cation/calcium exchanger 4 n=1 Tax=Zostera marina TaxID=29655 RepID=A0A0K9NPH4_ZOSMR|nr:Cation/calcium exchanger 4 [Zostera marina]